MHISLAPELETAVKAKVKRLRPDLFPGCRIAAEGRHVILFRANQETLEIVRVRHGAMDLRRHLTQE